MFSLFLPKLLREEFVNLSCPIFLFECLFAEGGKKKWRWSRLINKNALNKAALLQEKQLKELLNNIIITPNILIIIMMTIKGIMLYSP